MTYKSIVHDSKKTFIGEICSPMLGTILIGELSSVLKKVHSMKDEIVVDSLITNILFYSNQLLDISEISAIDRFSYGICDVT